jgi:hypothetical protein
MKSTGNSKQSKVMAGKQHNGKTTAVPRGVTQKVKKAEKEFTDRLREIISTQKKTWWREKLGVSQSLIGSRWEKGSFPRADKLIKLLLLSGYSANWLLFNIGPKHLEDIEEEVDQLNDDMRTGKSKSPTALLDRGKEGAEDHIGQMTQDLLTLKSMDWYYNIFKKNLTESQIEYLDKLKDNKEQFDKILVPTLMTFGILNDIILKLTEVYTKAEDGKKNIASIMEWIRDDFVKVSLEK